MLSSTQIELAQSARAFLVSTPAPSWAELAGLGWLGVSLPEESGGAGLGFVEEVLLHEELGRITAPGPFLATMLAMPALPLDEQQAVAAGKASWTLSLGPLVLGLDCVDRVAIVGGDGIYELIGADRALFDSQDETRPLGILQGGESGRRLSGAEILPALRTRALVALAAEAVGAGSQALELGVSYAQAREQFGRPIGSYQAIAHPLATSFAELELARSLTLHAASCVAAGSEDAPLMAAAAKAHATEAGVTACERSIQVHGGIGFTWEHPLNRLYKRVLGLRTWEASPRRLLAEIAETVI